MEPPAAKAPRLEADTICPVTIPPSDEEITETDLPLLANVEEVCIHHYLMKFSIDFDTKVVAGSQILFLDRPDGTKCKPGFTKIVLDACTLSVKNVYLLKTVQDYCVKSDLLSECPDRKFLYKKNGIDWFSPSLLENQSQLSFNVDKWSVLIQGWKLPESLPSVIRIDYETLEESPSVHWRPCDGYNYDSSCNKCLYSPAAPINNRGLFPCQEPPSSLATWEVLLSVNNEYTPLLTSDEPGEVIENFGQISTHYFYTSVPLPMSTFAMVVGKFTYQFQLLSPPSTEVSADMDHQSSSSYCANHISYPCRFANSVQRFESLIPVRLFVLDANTIHNLNISKLFECSLKSSYEALGPHPFSRQDVIIMPKCFPHMGLANPSMMFLSPCNFTGDEPLLISRIPHEICHSWFGLLIGALDWTEEWLSEGFATYCEDVLFQTTYHNYFPDKNTNEIKKEQVLRICLKLITLKNELTDTDQNLHIMSQETEDTKSAKNGLQPIKQFMHVHYVKGYLLLCHMAFLVGQHPFNAFLKEYVQRYHGQLVTSLTFLNLYNDVFKETLNANRNFNSMEKLRQDWLESNALPPPYDTLNLIEDAIDLKNTPLLKPALPSLQKIKGVFRTLQNGPIALDELKCLSSTERIILMEHILATPEEKVAERKLCYKNLKCSFQPSGQNPDVVHRWCELIIACKDKSQVFIVEKFLEENMAMGVYLYGELQISEKRSFQALAQKVFRKLEGLFDMNSKRLLREILHM